MNKMKSVHRVDLGGSPILHIMCSLKIKTSTVVEATEQVQLHV